MGAPQWVGEHYAQLRPYLEALDQYVKSVLDPYCERRGFALRHRVKGVESIAEKLDSGRYQRWDELDDLVAATIVVPNLTHEGEVTQHLQTVFRETAQRSRRTARTPPDTFRFSSTRWYGTVRNDPPPPIPSESQSITFEVQVQTALEHAWLLATHDMTYKSDEVRWQHLRLSASVKASVEQLDLMIANFAKTAESIPASPHVETDAKTYVVDVFRELEAEGHIPPAVVPASWSRFADNTWDLVRRWKREPATEGHLRSLVDNLAAALRGGEFRVATAGSLFQALVAFATEHEPALVKKTAIIPSAEFRDLYDVNMPPILIQGPGQ